MSTLFISHSSADGEESRKLQEALEKRGFRLFLDFDAEAGIQAGVSWERTLYTKLRACRAVVALASETYLASQWCFAEIALARMEGKQLFVLQIDPWGEETRMPSILTEEQFIDLRCGGLDEAAASAKRAEGYRRLWNGFENKGIVPDERPEDWQTGESPYPGLRAFDERDAPIFFGRDREIREGVELLNRVRRQDHPRLVMVLGSSGSGKSSLARAGIVPRLKRDRESWLVVGPFRPGPRPGGALARALADGFAEAGEPRSWPEIQERLGLSDEMPPTAEDEAAPAPAEAGPSPREKLRAALVAMEGVLGAADRQVARSVELLKRYLETAGAVAPADPVPSQAGGEDDPLGALAAELRRARTDAWLGRLQGDGLDEEALASERQLATRSQDAKLVLVIDQFEELLGHEKEGEGHPANRFLAVLKAGIEGDTAGDGGDDNPPLALGTMRSDFLGVLQRSVPLRGVGFKSLSVGPMSDDGMREVIERPAELGQIALEDGFANRLVSDTGTGDALPLLAFTLRAMWERFGEQRRFDARGYEEIGKLEGAIAQVADDTLQAALATGEEDARKESERELRIAFLSLARPAADGGGWARRPASLEEMAAVKPMIDRFLDKRLLVPGPDDTVEVAHEVLFRSWKTLRGWLDASREGLHLRGEIAEAARKWQDEESEEGKKDYLLQGGRLARARALRQRGVPRLGEAATALIAASEDEERRRIEQKQARRREKLEQARKLADEQRRSAERATKLAEERRRSAIKMKRAAVLVSLALVGALVAWWVAVEQRRAAQDQTRVAVAQTWLELDPTRAALVLLEVGDPLVAAATTQLMSDALREPLALFELAGHAGEVTGAAFSPDGRLIVTASKDKTARVWPLDEGGAPVRNGGDAVFAELPHGEQVLGAAFHPGDSRTVLTAATDGARLWVLDPGGATAGAASERAVMTTPGSDLVDAAFDDTGSRIVTAANLRERGPVRGLVSVWRGDGTPLPRQPPGLGTPGAAPEQLVLEHASRVSSASFSPGGDRIVTTSRKSAIVWDAATGERLLTLDGHAAAVTDAVYGRRQEGGRQVELIATSSKDDTGRVWDAAGTPLLLTGGRTGGCPCRPVEMAHGGDVYDVAVSPAGDRVLTASDDFTARLWLADGTPAMSPDGSRQVVLRHDGEINAAAFSPSGERIVTASKDGTARVWPARGGSEPLVLPHPDVITTEFTPRGGVLTVASTRNVWLWQLEAGGAALPSDELERLAVIREVGFEGEEKMDSVVLDAPATGARAEPDRGRFLTASRDGEARLWSLDGEPLEGVAPMSHGEAWVTSARFDGDRRRVVTASRDGTARVWNAADGSPVAGAVMSHGEARVHHAEFNPDGSRIVTASADGTAALWAPGDGGADDSGAVVAAALAGGEPRWRRLASLDHDGESVARAVFGPRGRWIVTASSLHARLWQADGSAPPERFMRHDHDILWVAFSPPGAAPELGDRLVTSSKDYTARVWPVDGRGEPLILKHDRSFISSASFSPDGNRVATTSRFKRGHLWSVSPDLLAAKIRAATAVCLDKDFRVTTLREKRSVAAARARRCREHVAGLEAPPVAPAAGAGPSSDLRDWLRAYRKRAL